MADEAIRNVSDTALWVAMYRALETERADAHFRDPFARLLAGARGAAIVKSLPGGEAAAWPLIVRTCVFDELILKAIRSLGATRVVNLAAGLDARPYRLDLPPDLEWIEADLPDMIDYKESLLAGETPRCRLVRERVDLVDLTARRLFLDGLDRAARPTLVVTEGLLVYLDTEAVTSLAFDLHSRPSLRWWLLDHASPMLLEMLEKRWGAQLRAGAAEFKFATDKGARFFAERGWEIREERTTADEARRLQREGRFAWLFRLMGLFLSAARKEQYRHLNDFLLLERF